jgi:hypothetical protein
VVVQRFKFAVHEIGALFLQRLKLLLGLGYFGNVLKVLKAH